MLIALSANVHPRNEFISFSTVLPNHFGFFSTHKKWDIISNHICDPICYFGEIHRNGFREQMTNKDLFHNKGFLYWTLELFQHKDLVSKNFSLPEEFQEKDT